jgi:hypothetical protein
VLQQQQQEHVTLVMGTRSGNGGLILPIPVAKSSRHLFRSWVECSMYSRGIH